MTHHYHQCPKCHEPIGGPCACLHSGLESKGLCEVCETNKNQLNLFGPTRTAEEALILLRKYRKALIQKGRILARQICEEEGTVHARRIYEEMKDEIKDKNVGSYWLGVIFAKANEFEWTGEWHTVHKYADAENCHGPIGIRIWKLKSETIEA